MAPSEDEGSSDFQAVSTSTTREVKSTGPHLYLGALAAVHSATSEEGVEVRAYELRDRDRPANGTEVMFTIDAGPDTSRTWKLPLDVRSVSKISAPLPGLLRLEGTRDLGDVTGAVTASDFKVELRYGLRDGSLADRIAFDLDGEQTVLQEERREDVGFLASVHDVTTASSGDLRASVATCAATSGTHLVLTLEQSGANATFDLGIDVGNVSKITIPRRGELRIQGDKETYSVKFSFEGDAAPRVVTLTSIE